MEADPVRIRLVGLFPAFMDLCCRKAPDPLVLTGHGSVLQKFHEDQVAEYPPMVLENQRIAEDLFQRLLEDFPRGIVIEVVGVDSLRGMWLSWRAGARGRFVVTVDDDRVFPRDVDYGELKAAVAEALEHRRAARVPA